MSRIFHIAVAAEWAAAQASGSYTVSTRGRSLADEGFIHCSHEGQWREVCRAFYADVTDPLILLVIDPDRLTAPLRVEEVPGSGTAYPHLYGPLNLDAVVEARPIAQVV